MISKICPDCRSGMVFYVRSQPCGLPRKRYWKCKHCGLVIPADNYPARSTTVHYEGRGVTCETA